MNNSHGILHKVVIAIGLFLGVTATGVGAKANTHQSVTTNHNNQQTNHINQSSIQNNKTTLINQQSDINNKINNLKQQPKVQTDNGQINNGRNNNTQEQSKQSAQEIHNQTQQLYDRIVSSGINRSTYKNSNSNNNDSKLYQVKPRQYSMGAVRAHRIHHYVYNRNNTTISRYVHHRNSGHDYYHGSYTYRNGTYSINSRQVRHCHNWFRDGLSHRNLRARSWVSMHESGHRWYVLSYGRVCVGYFQLNPHYLGYRHGHVDLRPKHQVKVADRYVRRRYGNWVNAKRFWEDHHWY